jgi:hypothetical protein
MIIKSLIKVLSHNKKGVFMPQTENYEDELKATWANLLRDFLEKGQDSKEITDIIYNQGLTKKQTKEFLMSLNKKSPCPMLLLEADPNSDFFRKKAQKTFNLNFFVDNSIGITKALA